MLICPFASKKQKAKSWLPTNNVLLTHTVPTAGYMDLYASHMLLGRPGFPFLGSDFFGALGDVFGTHAVENPDMTHELDILVRGSDFYRVSCGFFFFLGARVMCGL